MTTALQKTLATHPAPGIHHSDQGVHCSASGYVAHLQQAGVKVSMSAAGRPTENALVERVIRTLKDEEVSLNDYEDLDDAFARIGQFFDDVYNTKRVHSSLGYKTPAGYEALMRRFARKRVTNTATKRSVNRVTCVLVRNTQIVSNFWGSVHTKFSGGGDSQLRA